MRKSDHKTALTILIVSLITLLAIVVESQEAVTSSWTVYIVQDQIELTKRTLVPYSSGAPETVVTFDQLVACTTILNDGLMLAASLDDSKISSIDLQTGEVVAVLEIGLVFERGKSFGIAHGAGDELWIFEYNPLTELNTVYLADLSTGAMAPIGTFGVFNLHDIAYHKGRLFAAAFNFLLEIDQQTVQPTVIIEHPIGEMNPVLTELASDGENLWVLTNTHGFPGRVFRRIDVLDPSTGQEIWGANLTDLDYVTDPLTLDVVRIEGMAVPTVTSWGALLLPGLIALIGFGILRSKRSWS